MTSHNGRSGNGSGDLDLLRADIRRTRAELGQTVQALAAKTDVKSRVRVGAARTRRRLRDRADQVLADVRRSGPRGALPAVAVAGVLVSVAVVWVTMRGRRR
ncbi:DUF3618 domain-containing protein [Solwaraspora sp. WMMD791]|uniref:DUF3618 domain-containing protein n=1 Tax=Solwaraspora sp. WMMD791 TaxID=3016086 RepID=UPI00249BD323|nr:DUF3618 domain-containing protein [Solwaraspora sp. WMMD791]WFE28977.1 DUF3618 domain-containing protein [Solwaraspora sp. WMMD791]